MKRFGLLLFSPIVTVSLVFGASPLSPDLQAKVDQAAEKALADTGVPSASVAVAISKHCGASRACRSASRSFNSPARRWMKASVSARPTRRVI